MSDQIKALRDAANRCTRVNAEVALMCEAALAAVAEVEALRKKAARYDWLRDNWGYVSETYDGTRCESVYLVSKDDGWDTDPESLDAAIDAALRAKEAEHG